MESWNVRYTDETHDIRTIIENIYEQDHILDSLRLELDGVMFYGMTFNDFELADEGDLEAAEKKFTLLKWGKKPNYHYKLQRYSLEVEIPVGVVDTAGTTLDAKICFNLRCYEDTVRKSNVHVKRDDERVWPDKETTDYFYMQVGEERFEAEKPSLDFETSLMGICSKIKGKYLLKSCFGCAFSDYSPYGNSEFGMMLCFASVAERYLGVDDKISLWDVHESGEQQQETALCEKFRPRVDGSGGYRGRIY